MKSALELAMEKFGDEPVKKLTGEQKEKLAEVDRRFDAKIAEARIRTEPKLRMLYGEEAAQLQVELATEIAGYNDARERHKEKLRQEFE